jgi:hypothetical protein
MCPPAVDPAWQPEVNPVRARLRELLSIQLPVQAGRRKWHYLVQRIGGSAVGAIAHMATRWDVLITLSSKNSGKSICPRGKPKMKTPAHQILHRTAGSRTGLLAATLSLAIWTTAAANQAANVPAPSPNKLERITEFFNNEIATGKLPGAAVLIQQHGKPVYLKSFGVQAVETRIPMTSDTIFALHSNSGFSTASTRRLQNASPCCPWQDSPARFGVTDIWPTTHSPPTNNRYVKPSSGIFNTVPHALQ